MARVNGTNQIKDRANGQARGLPHYNELPPSTIASHLPPVGGRPSAQFDRESFEQLLEVSLGEDENGDPNLRDNDEENLKLIRVIVEAGIDPLLDGVSEENPFRAQRLARDTSHLNRCLDVLNLAVSRSPKVLHILSSAGAEENVPTFVWLILKVIPMIGDYGSQRYLACSSAAQNGEGTTKSKSNDELSQKARNFLLVCLSADANCEAADFCDIHGFVSSFVNDMLTIHSRRNGKSSPDETWAIYQGESALAKYLLRVKVDNSHSLLKLPTGCALEVSSLLCGLIATLLKSCSSYRPERSAARYLLLSTLLRQLNDLWPIISAVVFKNSDAAESYSQVLLEYFQILRAVSKEAFISPFMSMKKRSYLLWSKSLADCLTTLGAQTIPELEASVGEAFKMTLEAAESNPDLHATILEILSPHLRSLLDDEGPGLSQFNCLTGTLEELLTGPQTLNFESQVELAREEDAIPDGGRARKRLRLSVDEINPPDFSPQEAFCRRLTQALFGQPTQDLLGLHKTAPAYFRKLSDQQQYQVLLQMGRAACHLTTRTKADPDTPADYDRDCHICDSCDFAQREECLLDSDTETELHETILSLASIVNKSPESRILAMLAMQRLLMHCGSVEYLKLSQSPAGEWCLQSLKSSSRDVRLVGVQALRPFILTHPRLDSNIVRSNRITALDFLQALWTRNEVPMQETTVLALVAIARVIGDEEMNIILVRLVEYLGHGNPYINGLVYAELQNLAEALQMSISTLLSPYWRTIGAVVVKNLQSRPAMAQQLCELLGWHVDGLLVRVKDFALPYLVLMKKRDIINRIALAHEPPSTPFNICVHRQALQNILSFLLSQAFPDPEDAIMSLLLAVSEEFNEHDLVTWLSLESTAISCELLKAIVDAGEGRSSRPHQGLQFLAQTMSRKAGHSTGSKKSDSIGIFLENHALAITNQFIFTLNNPREPDVEKRRCLAAIGQVARLGKSRVLDALPQICACLRSSMESKTLCDAAFASWALMIDGLKEDDIQSLCDQTLAIIVRSWNIFSSDTQKLAQEVVRSLLKKHSGLIHRIISTMPSLSSIPLLADVSAEFENLKRDLDERDLFKAFTERIGNENLAVVEQALHELTEYLDGKSELLQRSILREQPDSYIAELIRALLDCCIQFNESIQITRLCGQCLGQIGCVDPSKIETIKEKKSIVVLSNFAKADETVDFIIFFLEHILIKAFLSASSTRSQGFLGWAMQELLKLCNLDDAIALRSRSNGSNATYRKWIDLPDNVRSTLMPFVGSRYVVQDIQPPAECQYPLFVTGRTSYSQWLRTTVLDFLHRAPGENPQLIFSICSRIVSGQDASIPSFLLPFATLNMVVSGIEEDKRQVVVEMLNVLRQPMQGDRQTQEHVKLCSESVFSILDYMFKWLQQKRKHCAAALARLERGVADPSFENAQAQIRSVEYVLESVPPDLISRRAIDCKSYSRALFNWENHIRQSEHRKEDVEPLLEHLQNIYAQIDEPDGIEGISSRLHVLDVEQQVLEHRKAGRWTAAQSWYEMQLVHDPEDVEIQVNLLQCLKESGQYDVLLHHFDGLDVRSSLSQVLPYAVEASWVTSRWDKLSTYLTRTSTKNGDFSLNVASVLDALHRDRAQAAQKLLDEFEGDLAAALTTNTISSLQSSHDTLLKLHSLHDIRLTSEATEDNRLQVLTFLDKRLDILGSYVGDKQFVLGIRRAAMELSPIFNKYDIASAWLASARLARKAQSSTQAFNAILHASALGEKSATIEQAKLMWQEGHHRKAIQTLEGAIDSQAFVAQNFTSEDISVTLTAEQRQSQNETTAKAYVLLGKWLDVAGQTQSEVIIKTFRKAVDHHRKWEKGYYYLGKYYNKIVDSERAKSPGKESQSFLNGESAKLVIDNFLRSSSLGSKYVFQTLPKILTLWLELVAGSEQPPDARRGNEKFQTHTATQRKMVVTDTNKQMAKYAERLQPIVLYTILPQVVARICHTNVTVYNILVAIVVRVVRAFPQQALWILLAVLKSQSKDRASRGLTIVSKACEKERKNGRETSSAELRSMITAGQKFFDEILRVSDFPIEGKTSRVSLARDLGFNHKIAPSRLVVPAEACLIPSLPTNYEPATMKSFRPFSKETVTISAFLDDALVLSSLQKPRKLSIRGSDGQIYGALAKPKDDLRKDQRLMEFNTMINRFLKRDVEASKRRLYIRTYAVVPLNEECGLIEWVDNLKTFRDIILKLYKEKNISPNYTEIRTLLDEASSGPPEKCHIFTTRVLASFPSLFHEWFVESFPDPSAWFNARLRYTRSCAVMSIVGHALGLGDRHGENILFEEDNGGTLHVDFNCLFDKGLTFEKPEMVPFRLTHNMIDAFGAYGYNGPFRKCCEITLTLLRGNEDALMTVLETFLHDPTTDFINVGKRKKTGLADVPDTPMGVLDGVRGKVRGMLAGESVPLSVGGYVEEMIKRATDEANLCRMYIGWCAFL